LLPGESQAIGLMNMQRRDMLLMHRGFFRENATQCISARKQAMGSGSKPHRLRWIRERRFFLARLLLLALMFVLSISANAVQRQLKSFRCRKRDQAHVSARGRERMYSHRHPVSVLPAVAESRNGPSFALMGRQTRLIPTDRFI